MFLCVDVGCCIGCTAPSEVHFFFFFVMRVMVFDEPPSLGLSVNVFISPSFWNVISLLPGPSGFWETIALNEGLVCSTRHLSYSIQRSFPSYAWTLKYLGRCVFYFILKVFFFFFSEVKFLKFYLISFLYSRFCPPPRPPSDCPHPIPPPLFLKFLKLIRCVD